MNTSVPTMKRLLSGGLSLALGVAFYFFVIPVDDRAMSILGVIASAAGTLLGFLLTAMTVLTAVMDRTLVANMVKTGHYQRLIRETFFCCAMLLVLLVSSVLTMFSSCQAQDVVFSFTIGMSVFCVCLMAEAGYRFKNVFLSLR